MKRWFWVLCLGLVACGSGGSPATGDQPTGQTSAAGGPKVVAVGQPMKASDGQSVTVLSFKRGFQTGNEFESPKAGHEYVQVVYKLDNGSSAEWLGPLYELGVVDSNGQKYEQAFVTTGSDDVASIVAGGHVPAAKQVYEVPKGAALDVVWTPNMFESTVFQTKLA